MQVIAFDLKNQVLILTGCYLIDPWKQKIKANTYNQVTSLV
jgi:hypothetical protein